MPKAPEGPPSPKPVKTSAKEGRLDQKFFGMASKKMDSVLHKEDWHAAGKQYLREDGIPLTFQDYFESRLRGDDKDHTVCECGKSLKPSQDSLWSHLSRKHCVPGCMWNIWMAEYEARMSSTPGSAKGSKVREKQERAKKEATVEGASRGIKRKADKSQETKEAQEERSGDEAKEPVVLTEGPGASAPSRREPSDDDSDVRSRDRGRRNRSPTPRREEPSMRKKRSEMTAEEKIADNYASRERKRHKRASRAEEKKVERNPRGKGKHKGKPKGSGGILVVRCEGWICASGSAMDEDPPEDEHPQPVEVADGEEPDPAEVEEFAPGGGAADRPVELGPNSKVRGMKRRLRELHAPVWGSKEILWERLQQHEAQLKSRREVAEQLQRREEAINRDPESARVPIEITSPSPPTDEEREAHSLTHLPFAPWCEICLRSRTRDNPHRSMPKEEEATALVGPALPLVSMDWFEVKGSPTDERSEESPPGFTQCLMVTDGQTGYVAAIPCPEKKNQAAYVR
jgi:hypothetical protein